MNNVTLIGRLCADPETRTSQSGKSITTFKLAVQRRFKNQSGTYDADFLSCIAFGNTADFVRNYFTKGRRMAVQGSIQTRSWDRDDGSKGYATEIIANDVEFVDSVKDSDAVQAPPRTAQKKQPPVAGATEVTDEVDPNELPF